MKFKRTAALLCAALLLAGCSSSDSKPEKDSTIGGQSEATSVAQTEEKKEKEEEGFKETVIYDQDGLKVTATGMEKGFLGEEVKMVFENNSDKNWTVQARNTSVNGAMIDPSMSIEVAPGKTGKGEMTFLSSMLEDQGIDKIHTIEFNLHFFNSDDFMDSVDSDLITLKTGEEESETDAPEGTVLVDQNGIKIISLDEVEYDEFFGADLMVYIENNSEIPRTVQARDCSINGYMVDPIFSSDVMPGKKVREGITIMSSDLEDNDIDKISEVELTFHIFNSDDLMDSFDIGPVTLNY